MWNHIGAIAGHSKIINQFRFGERSCTVPAEGTELRKPTVESTWWFHNTGKSTR